MKAEEFDRRFNQCIVDVVGERDPQTLDALEFFDDLGAYYLDAVEIFMEWEKEFGICLAEDDLGTCKTVADCRALVRRHIREGVE